MNKDQDNQCYMYLFQLDSLFKVQLNHLDSFFSGNKNELDEFSVIVGFVSINVSGSEDLSDLKAACFQKYYFWRLLFQFEEFSASCCTLLGGL